MTEDNSKVLIEIKEALEAIAKNQQEIMNEIKELRFENEKLLEEVRISNIVLNNITVRSEILN